MTFIEAMEEVYKGHAIRRALWAEYMHVSVVVPHINVRKKIEKEDMYLSSFLIFTYMVNGDTWLIRSFAPQLEDIKADDWETIE